MVIIRGGSTRLTFSNQVSLKGPNSSSLSLCLQTSAQQRLKEVHFALHRKSLKLISEFPNNTFQLQIDVCYERLSCSKDGGTKNEKKSQALEGN